VMEIFGWKLIDWQLGPWHWLSVNTVTERLIWDEGGPYLWVDRFICIGPLQTRWCK